MYKLLKLRKKGVFSVSNREKLLSLIEKMPEEEIGIIVSWILNSDLVRVPNEETLAAFQETKEMLENGTGQKLQSLDELFEALEV